MSIDRAVFAFAGIMIIVSVLLTQFVHPLFFWFTVFIGANMFQSAFSGWCPAAKIFAKLGLPVGCAFNK
ncbi:YgaP family membrane protein [Celeribacter sp. ULVN23_4]